MQNKKLIVGFALVYLFSMGCSSLSNTAGGPGGYRIEQVIENKNLPEETGRVMGVVKDAQSGERLSGGEFYIYSLQQKFAIGENGSFSQDLPAGKYVLTFESEGYDQVTTSSLLIRTKTSTFINVLMGPSRTKGPGKVN